MTVVRYLISVIVDFLRFCYSIFSFVLVSIEEIYQTLKTVFTTFPNASNSLLGVWKCGKTRPRV